MHDISKQFATDGVISFDQFLSEAGWSHSTGWRYRNRGWITVINIAGRNYVERAEIARFLERARNGEFHKPCNTPRRGGGMAK